MTSAFRSVSFLGFRRPGFPFSAAQRSHTATLGLVCILAGLNAASAQSSESPASFVITYDVSGSLAVPKYASADTHRRIQEYVSNLILKGRDAVRLSDSDELHLDIGSPRLDRPLWAVGARWSAYSFGDRLTELSGRSSRAPSASKLTQIFPKRYTHKDTRFVDALSMVCKMSDEAAASGADLLWVYVSDDLPEEWSSNPEWREMIQDLNSKYDWPMLYGISVSRDGAVYIREDGVESKVVYVEVREVSARWSKDLLLMDKETSNLIPIVDHISVPPDLSQKVSRWQTRLNEIERRIDQTGFTSRSLRERLSELRSTFRHFGEVADDREEVRSKVFELAAAASTLESENGTNETLSEDFESERIRLSDSLEQMLQTLSEKNYGVSDLESEVRRAKDVVTGLLAKFSTLPLPQPVPPNREVSSTPVPEDPPKEKTNGQNLGWLVWLFVVLALATIAVFTFSLVTGTIWVEVSTYEFGETNNVELFQLEPTGPNAKVHLSQIDSVPSYDVEAPGFTLERIRWVPPQYALYLHQDGKRERRVNFDKPFSIEREQDDFVTLLVKRKGRGTQRETESEFGDNVSQDTEEDTTSWV